jgi:hypothetical protein
MDGSHGDNTRYSAPLGLHSDSLTFELLVEKGGYVARHPAQSEIAIRSDGTHDVTRLVQGTDNQTPWPSAAEQESSVACPIPGTACHYLEQGIDQCLFIPGDCLNGGKAGG